MLALGRLAHTGRLSQITARLLDRKSKWPDRASPRTGPHTGEPDTDRRTPR
jgi:hypothetical protein